MTKIYLSPSSQTENPYSYGGTNEAAQCRRIAEHCEAALKRSGFEVKTGGGTMYTRTTESNNWGADLHVPIHTNAANGKTTGTRVYAYNSTGAGAKAAKAIFDVLAPITPGTSEGVYTNQSWHEIVKTKAPCAYLECEFHDNATTAQWIVEHVEEIGEAIAKGICNYFGKQYVADEVKLYRVQCGAFEDKANAERLADALKVLGLDCIIV